MNNFENILIQSGLFLLLCYKMVGIANSTINLDQRDQFLNFKTALYRMNAFKELYGVVKGVGVSR